MDLVMALCNVKPLTSPVTTNWPVSAPSPWFFPAVQPGGRTQLVQAKPHRFSVGPYATASGTSNLLHKLLTRKTQS